MKKIPFTITHKSFASHSLGILPVQHFMFSKMPLGNIVGLFLTAQIPEHLYTMFAGTSSMLENLRLLPMHEMVSYVRCK